MDVIGQMGPSLGRTGVPLFVFASVRAKGKAIGIYAIEIMWCCRVMVSLLSNGHKGGRWQ